MAASEGTLKCDIWNVKLGQSWAQKAKWNSEDSIGAGRIYGSNGRLGAAQASAPLLRSAPLGHGRQPSMRPTFIKLHNSDPIFRNQIGRGRELALIKFWWIKINEAVNSHLSDFSFDLNSDSEFRNLKARSPAFWNLARFQNSQWAFSSELKSAQHRARIQKPQPVFSSDLKSAWGMIRIQKSHEISVTARKFQFQSELWVRFQNSQFRTTDMLRFHISGLSDFTLYVKSAMSAENVSIH